MRLLLDTHTLIWAVDDPTQLGPRAAAELRDLSNELLLGAGALWEMSIKVGLQKLDLSQPYRQWMNQAIADLGLTILPITVEYADVQAGAAPPPRRPLRSSSRRTGDRRGYSRRQHRRTARRLRGDSHLVGAPPSDLRPILPGSWRCSVPPTPALHLILHRAGFFQ